ncbi:MAG: hypothetical protein ABEJ85_03215, partial [Haloarculaceae archaeon]
FFSRYCDERLVLSRAEGYADALRAAVERRRPDVVLPVGFQSVAALDQVRGELPPDVTTVLPPPASLERATDREKTLSVARDLGIEVPTDYTERVDAADGPEGRRDDLDELPFPLFLKARRETGRALSARVESPERFWTAYDALRSSGEELIVQECVSGDGRTYGCGLLFLDGEPRLRFGHVELRSVPRRGGSGTRLRTTDDAELVSQSVELLGALDWHGVALVEYRREGDSFVLMEINPKFWASYALASQSGHRFASTLVAEALGLPAPAGPPATTTPTERVFPLREFAYCLRSYERESLLEAASAMLWPPARPALNPEDAGAWLVPPSDLTRASRLVRAALDAVGRGAGVDLPEAGPDSDGRDGQTAGDAPRRDDRRRSRERDD